MVDGNVRSSQTVDSLHVSTEVGTMSVVILRERPSVLMPELCTLVLQWLTLFLSVTNSSA